MMIVPASDPESVVRAAGVLRRGGVIIYPTDTVYGLGADALSDEAVAKIYAIKGRDPGKPIHAIVPDIAMIEEYAEMNDMAHKLASVFWPGALTLILNKKPGIDTGIARGADSFGVRIPFNQFCLDLAQAFGRPITTTSANKSGASTPITVEDILENLGDESRLVDLVVDGGELPLRPPSSVVNVRAGAPSILREGAILRGDILSLQ